MARFWLYARLGILGKDMRKEGAGEITFTAGFLKFIRLNFVSTMYQRVVSSTVLHSYLVLLSGSFEPIDAFLVPLCSTTFPVICISAFLVLFCPYKLENKVGNALVAWKYRPLGSNKLICLVQWRTS